MANIREVKCTIKKYTAIDYSPLYEIYLKEPIKEGYTLLFDPAVGKLEIKK